ncbi:MAG: ROK family protein [Oscillospiraceae bacterium]|jgi:predicted NBD/HSP70 family sugar kinase|nr:ROK family protein [Oscillospiraceae bacterium]
MGNPISLLKSRHRQMAFDLLYRKRVISRVEIARELGVSLQTAMKIMGYFTDFGLAYCVGGGDSQIGRRPQMYEINPGAAYIIAAVNEGSILRVGVLNLCRELLCEETAELRGGVREALVCQPCEMADRLLDGLKREGRRTGKLLGTGVCLPAVVDNERRTISFAPSFTMNAPYQIGSLLDEIAERTGASVLIENDVNAAVYGECSCRDCADLAYINIGSGIGMGLVLDGKLRHGPAFTAGEIGIMPYNGPGAPQETRSTEDLIGLDALKKRFGFDRQFGTQAMDAQARILMINAVADTVGYIIAVCAAMVNISDFIVGGLTMDLLGEELFEALCRKAGKLSPVPVTLHTQSLACPSLAGAAQKVIDANIGALLTMDDETQTPKEENI